MIVIIFTYNRLLELQLTVTALKQNYLSNKVNLVVFSDGPKTEKDYENVKKVRKFIKEVKGFKSLEVIERKKNFGLARNIIEGVSEVINVYNNVIVLEDDLITSKNFLCYMKNALNFYEEKKEIFSISGYSMPLKSLKNYPYDTYLFYRPSSWGWATWKDRWMDIDWEIKDYENFFKDKKSQKDFNKGGSDLTRMLKHYFEGKNNSWAIRWSYNMWKQKKYCVYPTKSKIQNIGFGENATHCKGINIYRTLIDDTNKCEFEFLEKIEFNKKIIKEFKYQYSYINKFFNKIKFFKEIK